MKKLNKLQINSEKKLDNEELLSLRGGYDGLTCYSPYAHYWCWCQEGIGLWEACYDDQYDIIEAFYDYCGGFGKCIKY